MLGKLDVVLFKGADMSLASVISFVINTSQVDNFGVTLDWTGDPAGTWLYEASNDSDFEKKSGKFTPLTFGTDPEVPAGAAGDDEVAFFGFPYRALRATYTRASGSGTLNARVSGKGQGG